MNEKLTGFIANKNAIPSIKWVFVVDHNFWGWLLLERKTGSPIS